MCHFLYLSWFLAAQVTAPVISRSASAIFVSYYRCLVMALYTMFIPCFVGDPSTDVWHNPPGPYLLIKSL